MISDDMAGLIADLEAGYGDPRFYKIMGAAMKLHSQKNQDYTKGLEQGHLGNFIRSSIFKRMYGGFDWSSPFGTAIDFMFKQLDAAMTLYATKNQSVTGEDIPTRLQDVSVYATIAAILWEDEAAPKIKVTSGGYS